MASRQICDNAAPFYFSHSRWLAMLLLLLPLLPVVLFESHSIAPFPGNVCDFIKNPEREKHKLFQKTSHLHRYAWCQCCFCITWESATILKVSGDIALILGSCKLRRPNHLQVAATAPVINVAMRKSEWNTRQSVIKRKDIENTRQICHCQMNQFATKSAN